MSLPQVKLGERILAGDFNANYAWDLTYGVHPAEQTYIVSAARVEGIGLCEPTTLDISNVRKPLHVEDVYVLDVGAGPMPHQRALRVVDRRWKWAREWVSGQYNVRRMSGNTTLQSEAGDPIELAQTDPTLLYAKWSLDPPEDGSAKWTAKRLIAEIFLQLKQPFRFEGEIPQADIVDLAIEDNGAEAIGRVLAYLPGCDVYIDLRGVAVVKSTAIKPGDAPDALKRRQTQGGDLVVANHLAMRPRVIEVLFTPEVEMRFDSVVEGATVTQDTPVLSNVAPSPDLTLALSTGGTVARGTYVNIETLMASWGSVFGDGSAALSTTTLAQFGTCIPLLEATYVRAASTGLYSVVNGARVATVARCFRRVYQINPRFAQRIQAIRPNRAAVLNPATGTRARSLVYCDFLRRPNEKNPEAKGAIEGFKFGWFARGYAALLANCVAAPASVSIVNEAAGIIRFDPESDPLGKTLATVLGYPLNDKIPTLSGDAEANRTGDEALTRWQRCQLTTDFQVATVLTVIPASPNNNDRFHREFIGCQEAGYDGTGPNIQIRVMPSVLTARFAWRDRSAAEITNSILHGTPRPLDLLVNGQDVHEVALAAAKALYANLADTLDTRSGPVSVDMNPELAPGGGIGIVRHGLNNGLTTTTAMAVGISKPTTLWGFLPTGSGVRQTLLRSGLDIEK